MTDSDSPCDSAFFHVLHLYFISTSSGTYLTPKVSRVCIYANEPTGTMGGNHSAHSLHHGAPQVSLG